MTQLKQHQSPKKEAKEAAKEEMEADIKKASDRAYQNGLLAAEQMLGDKQEIEITKLKTQLTAERIDKERMQKHIEELRDKSQQRNNELQGEAQEVYLEDMLKEKFPNDEVSDIREELVDTTVPSPSIIGIRKNCENCF